MGVQEGKTATEVEALGELPTALLQAMLNVCNCLLPEGLDKVIDLV